MSNFNNKTPLITEKKSFKKKKEVKQSPGKNMEHPKSTTQRSKITLNWNQFLLTQNSDVTKTVKKDRKQYSQNHCNKSEDKNTKLQNFSPYAAVFTPQALQQSNHGQHRVDRVTTQSQTRKSSHSSNAVAIDCEMVGVGDGRENMLARVSIVDEHNVCVYDTFVKASEPVIDYRTEVSGVRPADMYKGRDFKQVQEDVYNIIHGKILIGHGISNDLKVLMLSHPKKYIRDTSKYKRFKEMNHGATPALKTLAKLILNFVIQEGEHSSVEDARATMNVYLQFKDQWEKDLRSKHYNHH